MTDPLDALMDAARRATHFADLWFELWGRLNKRGASVGEQAKAMVAANQQRLDEAGPQPTPAQLEGIEAGQDRVDQLLYYADVYLDLAHRAGQRWEDAKDRAAALLAQVDQHLSPQQLH